MNTGHVRQKFFLRYRGDDFLLYVFSLVLTGAVIWPILEHPALRGLLCAALIYLAWLFPKKHGWSADPKTLGVLLRGMLRYPLDVVRSWWSIRARVFQAVVLFALALVAEAALRPTLSGSFWLAPLPWWWIVWVPFALITAFRISVLIAHLLRADRVREVLEDSPIRQGFTGVSIRAHIVHAFITGLIAHLCMLAPCVIFYTLTNPSILRETLLLGGYVFWCAVAGMTGSYVSRERGGDGTPWRRFAHLRLFEENHEKDHRSRFFFTLFHGHHHDAIPSAMIGAAGGTGFLESTDRVITWLDFLDSVLVAQFYWFGGCISDMLGHQYIPGVFPFSRLASVETCNQHVAHHFGSLRPLGFVARAYVSGVDYKKGYRADNPRTRWFLDTVEKLEGLAPEQRQSYFEFGSQFVPEDEPKGAAASHRDEA